MRKRVGRTGTLCYNPTINAARAVPEGGVNVATVRVGKDESLDSALRRFKRQVQRSGILVEAKRHEHYEKPSDRRRRKAAKRARKAR